MTMNVGHIYISHFDYGGKLLFTNFFKVKIISSPTLYITDRREHQTDGNGVYSSPFY